MIQSISLPFLIACCFHWIHEGSSKINGECVLCKNYVQISYFCSQVNFPFSFHFLWTWWSPILALDHSSLSLFSALSPNATEAKEPKTANRHSRLPCSEAKKSMISGGLLTSTALSVSHLTGSILLLDPACTQLPPVNVPHFLKGTQHQKRLSYNRRLVNCKLQRP